MLNKNSAVAIQYNVVENGDCREAEDRGPSQRRFFPRGSACLSEVLHWEPIQRNVQFIFYIMETPLWSPTLPFTPYKHTKYLQRKLPALAPMQCSKSASKRCTCLFFFFYKYTRIQLQPSAFSGARQGTIWHACPAVAINRYISGLSIV